MKGSQMQVKILKEAGNSEALLGIGLSYNVEGTQSRADKLAPKDGGHNKFLESVVLWIDITAPRYWWCQFDTYRVGVSKQSESTMHTLGKKEFEQSDFESPIPGILLNILNTAPQAELKTILPESFLQRRIVCLNYKVLRHIFRQRLTHKLPQWQEFIWKIYDNCNHPNYLKDILL